jgi:hypothetical protein
VLVVIGAALIAAIGLLLTMPGGSNTNSTALSPLAQAAERTAAVAGARFSGTGSGTFPGGSMTMTFSGAYNGQANQSSMSADVHASGTTAISTSFAVVQDGLVTYMSSPLLGGQLPNGASWMKLDLSQYADDLPETQATESLDGRQLLDSLSEVSGDAQVVGTEQVRGVKTTRYSATVPTIEGQPPAAVSVWLDRKEMVRRVAMDMPFALPGQPTSSMSMSFDYYDFGVAPEIAIPPASDTFDATELSLQALNDAS